jgi:septal ring factor EnvC (AmiA/AmiB activator)
MSRETALEEERAHIEALIAQKEEQRQKLTSDLVDEEQRIAQMAREASSLKTLIARLTAPDSGIVPSAKPAILGALDPATRGVGETLLSKLTVSRVPQRPKFTEARGTLQLPVSGNILTTYGAQNAKNEVSMGLTIAAREYAQVIAPFDGNIVYAGPFLDYDQLLLIETGEGYHILFTGMARIYGQVGDRLLAGEPVGIMGQVQSAAPGGESQPPQLYIEFRKDGEPINPMPWLATNERKVSG